MVVRCSVCCKEIKGKPYERAGEIYCSKEHADKYGGGKEEGGTCDLC